MTGGRHRHPGRHRGVGLFETRLGRQTFGRHAHEGFAIGAIAEGAGGYFCRGENMVLPAGSLSLTNPEEPHTGHATAASVHYNMLHVSETRRAIAAAGQPAAQAAAGAGFCDHPT